MLYVCYASRRIVLERSPLVRFSNWLDSLESGLGNLTRSPLTCSEDEVFALTCACVCVYSVFAFCICTSMLYVRYAAGGGGVVLERRPLAQRITSSYFYLFLFLLGNIWSEIPQTDDSSIRASRAILFSALLGHPKKMLEWNFSDFRISGVEEATFSLHSWRILHPLWAGF